MSLVKFADGFERSIWTVAEAAGAVGIVAGYQGLPLPDVPEGYVPLVIILVAGLLAAIKSAVAQKWGNGTAATLPEELEAVPPEVEVVG
jgi:hypothetical protein